MEVLLALEHLAALDLDRDVMDPHRAQDVVSTLEHVLMFGGFTNDGVRAHGNDPGRHGPHMEVVDGLHSGNTLKSCSNIAKRNV